MGNLMFNGLNTFADAYLTLFLKSNADCLGRNSASKWGNVIGIAGIDTLKKEVKILIDEKRHTLILQPNSWYGIENRDIKLIRKEPFDYPL